MFMSAFLNFIKNLASCFSLLLDFVLREVNWPLAVALTLTLKTDHCQCYNTNGVRNYLYRDGHETFKLKSQCFAQAGFSWVDANRHGIFEFGLI